MDACRCRRSAFCCPWNTDGRILPKFSKKRDFCELFVWIQVIAKAAEGGNFRRQKDHEKYRKKRIKRAN
jgi:hypothetical protein